MCLLNMHTCTCMYTKLGMFSYISVLHEILKGMSCEEEDDIMEKLEYNLLVIYVRLNYEIINVCV